MQKLKRLYNQVRGFFPSQLPQGMEAFEAWVDSIFNTYELPTMDKDSVKFGLSAAIMHLGPTTAYKSKWYFVLIIKAGAAKQIAGAKFHEVKLEQQRKAMEAAQAAAEKAEAEERAKVNTTGAVTHIEVAPGGCQAV